ncbi:S53 family peptidase [Dyella nitratireducens]|uniref:Sedolisin n=1 Tax=Dyella nitratireducens TaxID=1849580 RepID=A0ABQ1FQ72_9GAMM|nr:S53 family peptidase [Dyella nitratireducens]GGA25574.1 sedolisin [Dyella nitratireducens]GLQ43667.1 sedolisin [Dyella nitratireducens]
MRFGSVRPGGHRAAKFVLSLLAMSLASAYSANSHATIGLLSKPQITQAPSNNDRVAVEGNVNPFATAANDRGRVDDSTKLDHMLLQLQRPADREAALEAFMQEQTTKGSPNYHHWLTAAEFGQDYGPSQMDIDAVTSWLKSQGFTVNRVYESGMTIDFSGTAAQVRNAFATEVHHLNVNGENHIANMSNPQIPRAFAGVVKGVVSLNDFRPHRNYKQHVDYTFTSGSSTYQAATPADLATIYNLNPLFNAGVNGTGQTIVLVEDTNVYSASDITTFRSTFGLPTANFTQVHPSSCTNPGDVTGNDGEAELDVEYAGAAAPYAALELASCADTSTTFGGLIAVQNLINGTSVPKIMSISYGECEAENGATANAAYISTYQQAASEGVSVFVSSGDEGAASCDADLSNATHGIGVSGFASTPYNVAVGGTDFGDTYAGTNSTYWNSTNTSTYGSAKSYIPEIPWNDSCAGALLSKAAGYSTPYGKTGFCNSTTGKEYYLTTASGSGGPSGCASGSPSTSGVVSGTCKGTAKPSWQSIVGNPADGVRDIPDVSLFAANGVWGHYYVYCYSNTAGQGVACTGAPSGWAGAGGTSFAAPIMAGIQALVNEHNNLSSGAGNPNPVYYSLASTEYGTSGSATCNSSNGNTVGSSCVFYDITQGDMSVNCTGTHNCYKPSGTYGVLSTSTSSYAPAYGTGTGWDFATGIGSVNAYNLVYASGW